MANHVSNILQITARDTEQSVKDIATLSNMFNNAIDAPDDGYDIAMELYPLNDEKEWRYDPACELWGSKWVDVDDCYSNDKYIHVRFTSAWDVPTGLLLAICDKFDVNVTCRFEDEFTNFFGHFTNQAHTKPVIFYFDLEGGFNEYSYDFETWDAERRAVLAKNMKQRTNTEAA